MGRTEMILKVTMAPVEQVTSFVDQVTKLVPDLGPNEFAKILDMKGYKRTEQGPLLDLFKTKTSGIYHNQFQELESPETNVESSRIKKLEKLIKKRL